MSLRMTIENAHCRAYHRPCTWDHLGLWFAEPADRTHHLRRWLPADAAGTAAIRLRRLRRGPRGRRKPAGPWMGADIGSSGSGRGSVFARPESRGLGRPATDLSPPSGGFNIGSPDRPDVATPTASPREKTAGKRKIHSGLPSQ
ncbi:uncharacterized protein LOC144605730 [Rhinoraja longicauda]